MSPDIELRLRTSLDRAARDLPVVSPPSPTLLTTIRHRRRRRVLAMAVVVSVALTGVATAASILFTHGTVNVRENVAAAQPRATPSVHVDWLPASPLAAREDPASVWTGREMIVWGGRSNGNYLSDGAAFNPANGRWHRLPQGPLSGRAGAAAAWTGTEMILWGGENAVRSPQGINDAAAYDPTSNQWRRLAAAPVSGRHDAHAFFIGASVFIVGGVGPQDEPAASTVLVLDTRTGRWSTVRVTTATYDAVAVGNALVTAEVEPTTGDVILQKIAGDAALPLPRPSTATHPFALGLAWLPGSTRLVLTVTDRELGRTNLYGLDLTSSGATWKRLSGAASETFTSPVETESTLRGSLVTMSGDRLLSLTRSGLSVAQPPHASRLVPSLYKAWGYCGVQGASVWTGSAFLVWGGQSCSGSSAADTGQGLAIHVQ